MTTIDLTDHPLPVRGPWKRGAEVVIEEHPGPVPGYSTFMLPHGKTIVVMDDPSTLTVGFALATLWRAIANASHACPVCTARFTIADDGMGAMEHEGACPLSDDAIRAGHLERGQQMSELDLPERPRAWRVRPPTLTTRNRK